MPSVTPRQNLDSLDPSAIAEYISFKNCPQFHKYEFDDGVQEAEREAKPWKEAFEPFNMLLAKDGYDFEEDCIEALENTYIETDDRTDTGSWYGSEKEVQKYLLDTIQAVKDATPASNPKALFQQRLGDEIGVWPVFGDADVMLLWPEVGDSARIRILDIKSAYEQKTYQQIQVSIYTYLLQQFLDENDIDNVEIEGGVWTRETEINNSSPDAFPKFDALEARESDVRRLLKEGGEFDRLYEADNDDVKYQLGTKCQGCSYREACYTNAIENASTALLGLSRGEQKTLEEHGIDTLHDLASLAYPPTDPKPFEYNELQLADETTYNELIDESGIGQKLPRYVQRAQSLLARYYAESEDDNMFARNDDNPPWFVGVGDGQLPADDPPYDADLSFEPGSMIRVYLQVQRDHRRDKLTLLNAFVTATNYEDNGHEPQRVSVMADELPSNEAKALAYEESLIEEFFEELFDTITTVAAGMGITDRAATHFYTFTSSEQTDLNEALKRHDSLEIVEAVRDLTGLRYAIRDDPSDQSMISTIQTEVQNRKALPTPNAGLLPLVDEFYPNQNFFYHSDWEYTRSDGVEVNLRNAFNYKLFDYSAPYVQDGDTIELLPDGQTNSFYPSRPRGGANIPLEYIWAAQGRLDDDWVEHVENNFIDDDNPNPPTVEPFRWLDHETKANEITKEDVKALGERFAACVAHIERALVYRNGDIAEDKELFPLDELDEFTLGENSITRSALEFLDLEYNTTRTDTLTQYGAPPIQRVRSGEAIPMVIRSIDEVNSSEYRIKGDLLYDAMFDQNSDHIANSCRQKGSDGATSGSWMVANELTPEGKATEEASKPRDIEEGMPVTIEKLDLQKPNREIEITATAFWAENDKFTRRHRLPTTDKGKEDEYHTYIEEDTLLILDPRTDDLLAQRSHDILQHTPGNYLTTTLEDMIAGNVTSPVISGFINKYTDEFISWLISTDQFEETPNKPQKEFIREDTAQFSLLQGPPGTGKTSFTMAPALLARVYSYGKSGKKLSGMVVGESNKAVDELLDDTAGMLSDYRDDGHSEMLKNLELVRLVTQDPEDPHPAVNYVNYSDDPDAVADVIERLKDQQNRKQQTFGEYSNSELKHLLLFTTPSRLYSLLNRLDQDMDDSLSPEDWAKMNASFFDLMAIDEASMMRLPSFLMTGAFIHDHAQVMIGGDHRQMPPVTTHDWENETRPTIEELVPYLSVLDYMRLLNGQDVDAVYNPEQAISGDGDMPMAQLNQTFRCDMTVARFLRDHVYEQDGIGYRATKMKNFDPVTPQTEGIETVLDPDKPLVLILHDDDTSQQSNPDEAAVARAIQQDVSPSTSLGIVTPHNAQRGLMNSNLPDNTEVDTVERFQGGQRDMIMVSATASDPDFLEAESDFILNPNRLNVAMSRMKEKLVVVASREVFNMIPSDVDKYDQSLLWKGLYNELEVNDRDPDWEGTIEEFTPKNMNTGLLFDEDTELSVFTTH